eukprot:753097-Hanusia_phi.AAC.1
MEDWGRTERRGSRREGGGREGAAGEREEGGTCWKGGNPGGAVLADGFESPCKRVRGGGGEGGGGGGGDTCERMKSWSEGLSRVRGGRYSPTRLRLHLMAGQKCGRRCEDQGRGG